MRIIVCGAGLVGTSIAKQLAMEENDVTVIDQSADLIQKISDTLDVKAKRGYASHPTVLKDINAENADMLIAVTQSDEVNMIACQVAHSLFNVPTKIARVRNQNYLHAEWMHLYRHDHLPIDFIISPEVEVAKAIINRLHVPGATDTIPFAKGKVKLIGVRCNLDCPMINMALHKVREKCLELHASLLAISREDEFIVASENTELIADDQAYFVCADEHVQKVMELFGYEEREARRIVLIGGGNIGLFLAEHLEAGDAQIKLIELDKSRAEFVADRLSKTTVINGDALSQEILEEVNVATAETVIAVTNDDEVNILSTLLSKRFGCDRAISLVNNANSYSPLMSSLGIDVTVNPKEITVSTILQHIRKGRIVAVHSICKGKAEVIEAEVVEESTVVDKPLTQLALPQGVIIGAILRGEEVLLPEEETVIKAKDRVIILAQSKMIKKVENLFSVKFEFF